MIFSLLPPLAITHPVLTTILLIAAAAIVVFEMLRWIVGRIVQEDPPPVALPSDAELQKLNEDFGRGNPPVVATRDTRFQSAVSDISPGDVVVISEPKPPAFIRLAREQYPNIGIEDDDDIQIVAWRIMDWRFDRIEDRYRVVEWRLCQLEDRLEHLEAARKPINKRREKKGGKR